jgi:hypothetical protein
VQKTTSEKISPVLWLDFRMVSAQLLTPIAMKFIWNIRGRFSWVLVLGTVMLLICGPLSELPAVYLSQRTPHARVIFDYPTGHPVWVEPWLYCFSKVMRYLAIVGIALVFIGGALGGARKRNET